MRYVSQDVYEHWDGTLEVPSGKIDGQLTIGDVTVHLGGRLEERQFWYIWKLACRLFTI